MAHNRKILGSSPLWLGVWASHVIPNLYIVATSLMLEGLQARMANMIKKITPTSMDIVKRFLPLNWTLPAGMIIYYSDKSF